MTASALTRGPVIATRLVALSSLLLAFVLATQSVLAGSSGWLDASFGQNGTVDLRTGRDFRTIDAVGVARGPRGVVVLSAAEWALGSGPDNRGYRLDGITFSGHRDATFNGGTPKYAAYVTYGRPSGIVARSGGFLVLGVGNDSPGVDSLRVHGYDWTGKVQPAWTEHVEIDYGTLIQRPRAVVLPDGSLRVCFTVVRAEDPWELGPYLFGRTAAGARDVTVGPNGLRRLDLGPATTCEDLWTDASGRLLAVGNVDAATGPAVIGRFSVAGVKDTSYGSGGHGVLDWSARAFRAHRMVRIGNSAIIAGQSRDKVPGAPWIAFTARFGSDGTLESGYGYGGVYRYPGGDGGSILRSIDPVPISRLVMGIASLDGSQPAVASERLVRIDPATGRLDPAFGRNGSVGVFHEAVDTTFDASGRTITVGSRVNSSTSILVQRRHP